MTSAFPGRIRNFIRDLDKDFPTYNDQVDDFFDQIGFRKPFPSKVPKNSLLRSHTVKDNIWGMIEFDEPIRQLIDSPLVQRLRGIRQNGLSHLTYPTATHTRFAHTLGVYSTASRLLGEIEKTHRVHSDGSSDTNLHAVTLNPKTASILKRAAILHDVGHGPYSHVSEKLFSTNVQGPSFAGIPIATLQRRFRMEYFGIGEQGGARPSGGKPLSELISVLFVCSDRFQEFYKSLGIELSLNEESDVFNIATLILGDRLTDDDLATPAILSSAIDADKIDYMLRDAHACGISLTIDPSRTFQGAGVYSLPVRDDPYFREKTLTDTSLVRVFVIDKSGSDTYFQVGASRLSLYSRIYHHPFTRNAEFQLFDLLKKMTAHDGSLTDVLNVWSMSEGEIFNTALASEDAGVQQLAHSFIWRSFPKRAANLELGSLTFCFASPLTSKVDNNFSGLVTDALFPAFEQPEFVAGVADRLAKIGKIMGMKSADLDRSSINLRYLPSPSSEDAVIGHTRLIDRASQRLVKCEFHVPSYLQAGALAERRSYVVVREGLCDIAAVATALEIFSRGVAGRKLVAERKASAERSQIILKEEAALAPKEEEGGFVPKEIAFFPILDMPKVSNTCKISQGKIAEIFVEIEKRFPTDPAPRLLNRPRPSTVSVGLIEKFKQFQGAKGWKVDHAHLLNFVSQFPSGLRGDVLSLLDGFHIFDRDKICKDIQKALNKFSAKKVSGSAFVVPFTMNSGHLAISYLRDSVKFPDDSWVVKDSLRAALADLKPGDWIVFVDDHAASGTQVRRRLSQWVKGGEYAGGDTKLEGVYLPNLRAAKIAFAFASMTGTGAETIRDLGADLELDITEISYGVPFEVYSLKKQAEALPELRDFISQVGTGLMLPKFDDPKRAFKRSVSEARGFSLGYQNAEGGLITELNVPTSTFTPFWRPGFYDPSGRYRNRADCSFPWVPLFIRSSHVDDIVLF